ncbi:hypothetical protein SAMN05518856_1227 [Paenibacillus sp. OK003]|uniref:ACT domain-containing protein n=1 Tax=Paenibacillus pabuli TaxID=1472 RepID=A0ABX9BL77_9BACL|nr:hypothetical protein DET54_105259 [Paenibacillus pabuli]SEL88584.1 hypothetical protein SAMN05518856_1227 [Paenibacillus sp. OK003]
MRVTAIEKILREKIFSVRSIFSTSASSKSWTFLSLSVEAEGGALTNMRGVIKEFKVF